MADWECTGCGGRIVVTVGMPLKDFIAEADKHRPCFNEPGEVSLRVPKDATRTKGGQNAGEIS